MFVKRALLISCGCMSAVLTACGEEPVNTDGPTGPTQLTVTSIAVSPSAQTLASLGRTVALTATATASGGQTVSGVSFTWSSSDTTVATVSSAGTVSAVGNGQAQISATASGVTGSATITVQQVVAQMAFATQPSYAEPSAAFDPAVVVELRDSLGSVTTSANADVTLVLINNSVGGNLVGTSTVSAAAGVATFAGLAVDKTQLGYILRAASAGLDWADSDAFNVFLPFGVLSAGHSHTCGITPSDVTYCWGSNDSGQVGDGTVEVSRPRPTAVQGGHTFTAVSAGWYHSCGLTRGGSAYCWGANEHGQLGNDGAGTSSSAPVQVAGSHTFTEVQAGYLRTCGLTSGGDMYCWGESMSAPGVDSDVPTLIAGATGLVSLRSYARMICGITGTGTAHCTATDDTQLSAVTGGTLFDNVSAGDSHACGVSTAGTGYCWGENSSGQLGDGSDTDTDNPVAVDAAFEFTVIEAGGAHTCGLRTTGAAYCWGRGQEGQIGNGNAFDVSVPTPTTVSMLYSAIAVGGLHSCAININGAALCWGSNSAGQLGDGTAGGSTWGPETVIEP